MNILIADNSSVVRVAMRQLIKEVAPTGVVYEAESPAELTNTLNSRELNLVIVDPDIFPIPGRSVPFNARNGNGYELIGHIKSVQPAAHVLVFSTYHQVVPAATYFEAGADGYLKKNAPTLEIRSAIKAMIAGHRYRDTRG